MTAFDEILKKEAKEIAKGISASKDSATSKAAPQELENPLSKEQKDKVNTIIENRPNVDFTQKYQQPFRVEAQSTGTSFENNYLNYNQESVGLSSPGYNSAVTLKPEEKHYDKMNEIFSRETFKVSVNLEYFDKVNPADYSVVYKDVNGKETSRTNLADLKGDKVEIEVDYSNVKQGKGDFNRGTIEIVNNKTGEVALHQDLNANKVLENRNIDKSKPVAIIFTDTNAHSGLKYDQAAADQIAYAQAMYGKDNVIVLDDYSARETAMFVDAFNQKYGKDNLKTDFYTYSHHGKVSGIDEGRGFVYDNRGEGTIVSDKDMVHFINNIQSQEPKFIYSTGCQMDPKPFKQAGINIAFPATYNADNLSTGADGIVNVNPKDQAEADKVKKDYGAIGGIGFMDTVETMTNPNLTAEQKQEKLQNSFENNPNINYNGSQLGPAYNDVEKNSQNYNKNQQNENGYDIIYTAPEVKITAYKEDVKPNELPTSSNVNTQPNVENTTKQRN